MPVAIELERRTLGRLELSDGTKFDGVLYGSCSCAAGEVVFQTGVVGYIESLSDPSYHSQILILTYPSIAMDELDEHELPRWFESKCIYARALVVSELCIEYSHFAAKMSIDEWLKEQRVTCLSNVDTRALTLKLRQHGTMLGRIYPISDEAQIPGWYDPSVDNLAAAVSSKKKKIFNHAGDVHVAVIDCGLKLNQIRCFIKRGAKNHGYAVDASSLPDGWYELFRNANDQSNEGLAHHTEPWMSVQFHPEHMAGPQDLEILFDIFLKHVRSPAEATLSDRITEAIHYEQLPFEKALTARNNRPQKVLLLGSGGLSIGQAGEFDYSGSQALKALREECIQTLLVNPNVATVQTTAGMADKIFLLPVTPECVSRVIEAERPDGIIISFGGQTGLTCGLALATPGPSSSVILEQGDINLTEPSVLETWECRLIGTPASTTEITEDRQKFAEAMHSIGEQVAPAGAAHTVREAVEVGDRLGYPVLIRAAFALGGMGSGFADNAEQLEVLAQRALSQTTQIFIDKSLKGWKEVEYEVLRDAYNNCITVCNMENVDPVGIHTGESIVVAPSQTLSNVEYNMLRSVAIKVARHLHIVGECNIQFALDPNSLTYYIIEVNARLSRSSALASKATGYPLAYIAAKLCLGRSLAELTNVVTGDLTTACFEPSLDYCVVKVPRWDLSKFTRVPDSTVKKLVTLLADGSVELHTHNPDHSVFFPLYLICCAKRLGFSDIQIAHAIQSSALSISLLRERLNMGPTVRQVDTVAGEWPATTNYLYVSYADLPLAEVIRCRELTGAENVLDGFRMAVSPVGKHDVDFQPHTSIMVLGSGVYRIGSSVEFDWCAVGCVRELRRLGWPTVMLNCNPETVSTDFDMCDRLYFDELSLERVLDIFKLEISVGVIVSMGGQTPNNIVMPAHRLGVPILGTSAESIDTAENRFKFSRLLDCMGISQPRWKELTDLESARAFCREVGYPCLVRPSYVLSGAAMNVAYDDQDLVSYLSTAKSISPELPVVITQFILDAKEIDVDAVAQSGRVIALAVSEHVENAGVHSGDATLVTPPQDLNLETLDRIRELVVALADELQVSGPFNLQLIAKDNRLQIIEANLRVSRSLPFVSKTLKYDFVAAATRCILGSARESIYPSGAENLSGSRGFLEPVVDVTAGISGHVGVKVPVFSFSRLLGAEVLLGVEMVSTGEVACFGQDRYEAYLLAQTAALCNTNGRLPKPRENIFLSIGSYRHKVELMTSLPQNCDVDTRERTVQQYLTEKQFALIVSLTMRKTGYRRQSAFVTRGYMTRRLAVETNVPLITDVKLVKLLAEALYRHYGGRIPSELELDGSLLPIRKTSTEVDHSKLSRLLPIRCITSSRILFLPGLVDIHVHTRDPGHEYKEDWSTATVSALAGGVVTVFAMPNTDPAVVDETSLHLAAERAATRAYCDYGLYVGATADNPTSVVQLSRHAIGLKMYLNETFTTLSLAGRMDVWRKHFESWPANRPICCHAEGETIAAVLLLAELTNRAVHICHVSRKSEIELIRDAKARGLKVTCEVCPHHLFLTLDDMPKEGGWAEVRPRLGTREDIEALWANLNTIDCFATDHAPHLASEKARDKNAPPGFPGLETMLPLLLTAMCEGRLTLVDLIERLHVNPLRIFGLAAYGDANDALDRCTYGDTWVEVDLSSEWYLPGAYTYQTPVAKMPTSGSTPTLYTRAGWSPFAGRRVRGRVRRVMLRGSLVFVDNRVLVKPGYGMNVMNRPVASSNLTLEQPTVDTVERAVPPAATSSSPSPRIRMDSCSERIWEEIVQHTSFSVQTVAPSGVTGPSSSANQPIPGASGTSVGSHNLWIDGISGKHVLSSGAFTKTALHRLFNLAHSFRQAVLKSRPLDSICRGKVMASLFFEPSTRTCNSFTVAMQRLGGSVVHFTESLSSLSKGETLADTFRILASYSDCLVVRHPGQGAIQTASTLVNKPIINAGDGVGEHPTQALLDVFTIREEIGTVNNLTVTMVGDLANGRTVHSLARLLCLYNVRLRYVTHCDELRMPEDVKAYVASRGIQQEEMTSLVEALPETDVLYMTRVQAERIRSGDSRLLAENQFVITPELMTLAKPTGMIVMHPLPRVGEISFSFDSDPRAAYFRQAEYGMYVRMALLAILLADPKH
ncbi:Carbamoyl-phosphate synthase large chain [Fasciola hepatica]|uniref:Carbamoyl phosphate synthase arginine-specific large chain n=1 Tax=Fasciola hepatica TaxID=6192 RepID=A0A4E0R763_FASHE|nr:Carbamoyl-phosphate synthase large chain [Fasciola hepatica]